MGGKSLTIEEFIKKANLKHSNKYSYNKAIYKNSLTKLIITCPEHGDFEQTPNCHIYYGSGCSKCADKTLTTEKFIEKANIKHSNKYSYSKVIYKSAHINIIITCPEHGDFEQTPSNHLYGGTGCFKCCDKRFTLKEFIKRSNLKHSNKYSYSKVIYINAYTKVIITCPEHGDFEQIPNNHLCGGGCIKCAYKIYSKISINWIKFIESMINEEIQNMLSPLGEYKIPTTNYLADGYCKKTNTIYEFHGDFWHGNPKVFNKDGINKITKKTYGELYQQTQTKKKKIMELGYNYVEMWEYDWKKSIKAVIKIQRLWKEYFKKISKNKLP